MHVQIAKIHVLRSLVIGGAKSCQSLIIEISFNRIDALDHHVESNVEFLVIDEQGILYVALDQELLVKRILG